MVRLPVSGTEVRLRLPNGADDMALNEAEPAALPAALLLLGRLATPVQGEADWANLPVTDFEILLLHLRKFLVGGSVASHVACPACHERVEISFRIEDYIAAVRPAGIAGVTPARRDGWLTLNDVEFRLPTVGDLLAVRHAARPGEALRTRCLAADATGPARPRIEGVIGRLAPQATGHVGGACPECGAAVRALFDVVPYVITELRRQAAGVYAEVHALATAYGWDEAAILALPGPRRRHYADLIRDAASARALVA